MGTPSSPPPIDPHADAAQQDELRRLRRGDGMGMAAALGQFVLTLLAGGWAAAASMPTWPDAPIYGAAALMLALAAAWAVVYLLAWVAFAFTLPHLIRFAVQRPALAQRQSLRRDRQWEIIACVLHALTFAFGAAAVVMLLWAFSPDAALLPMLLRFLAVVGMLSLLTPRALRVMG